MLSKEEFSTFMETIGCLNILINENIIEFPDVSSDLNKTLKTKTVTLLLEEMVHKRVLKSQATAYCKSSDQLV